MKYQTFEKIVSPERIQRYLEATAENKQKAMQLYKYNVMLSHDLFSVICYFEIALRNAIDAQLKINMGNNWLRDAVIRRPCAFASPKMAQTRKIIKKEYEKLKKEKSYTHTKLLSAMEFGVWRYMYSGPQYFATGGCLMTIFSNKSIPPKGVTYNQKYMFNMLARINELRNRIAHHEPICFRRKLAIVDTSYARLSYNLLLELLTWMNIDTNQLLKGTERVIKICDRIDHLMIQTLYAMRQKPEMDNIKTENNMKKLSLLLLALASVFTLRAETFVKVTDAASLQDGDQVVLGYADKNHVSAGFSSTKKYIDITSATFDGDNLTLNEPTVITLQKSGTYWNLYIGTKPIGNKSGISDLDVNQKTVTDFAISIENGNAKIVSQTPGKNDNEVFFAYNPSSPRFALYHSGSNMKAISLYRLDENSIPDVVVKEVTIDPAELTLRVGDEATLTATLLPADAVDKTIEWGSTQPEVATVSNGVVTAVAKGTAQIWVKATAVGLADTCLVTVLGAMDQTTVTYNAVKDPACLTEGAKVFFGTSKEGEDYIMGFYSEEISKNNIKGVSATYGENRHTVTAEQAYAYTVKREGDYYIFVDQDGNYLRPISDSKLRSSTTLDNQAKWTISAINQDDATVEVKNAGFTSRYIYNNCQGTNEIFNIYSGYDPSYLAKTILYASTAPEWEDRVLDSWMAVDTTLLDWGQIEPDTTYASDENWKDWGDARRFTLTFNDLTDDITVTLTGSETFYCGTTLIRKDAKQPVEITVYWETDEVGVYTGQLSLSTATEGVEDIVIDLRAEAVPMGTFPDPNQPVFSLSTKALTFNLNPDNYSDLQMFTFSASNLQKTLYCKWQHNSSVLFRYEYENACMEILAGDYELELNGSVPFAAGYDYVDEEVYVSVDNLWSAGNYVTQLHFYSYAHDSKEELAIDEYVTIRVKVSSVSTDVEEIGDEARGNEVRKILRDGRLIIVRNGIVYSARGERLQAKGER